MSKSSLGNQATAAPASKSVPVKTTASFTFDEMSVKEDGGRVRVDAKVTIMDSRPGSRYMWSLLVMNQDYTLLASTDYTNQVFSTRPGETINPTFEETFPFRPGTYLVELRLYEVTPDMNPALMNATSAVLVPQILLSHNERVTLPE